MTALAPIVRAGVQPWAAQVAFCEAAVTQRIVCWFSCGAASAVATKLLLSSRPNAEVVVARIDVAEEDADNARFAADCEQWFGVPIRVLRSTEYASCEELWEKRRYMSGPRGAICTGTMKKAVRYAFEAEWHPDQQVFGFTDGEADRANNMRAAEPSMGLLTPLIEERLSKDDCFAIVQRAGLVLPRRYRQGFANANCKGCVKMQSPAGWNRERHHKPDVFARRAEQSRRLGVRLVKLTTGTRERIFLDELDPADMSDDGEPNWDCGIACAIAESKIDIPVSAPPVHAPDCEWHLDQYPWECTCGHATPLPPSLTIPVSPWCDGAGEQPRGGVVAPSPDGHAAAGPAAAASCAGGAAPTRAAPAAFSHR